jgi:hypothetical protein
MRQSFAFFGVVLGLVLPAVVLAEAPPEEKAEANLVIVGTVLKITSSTERYGSNGTLTHYVVHVRVKRVERGRGARAGAVVRCRYFDVTRMPSEPTEGASGQRYRVRRGDRVRVYLMRRDEGGFDIIYNPAGIERLGRVGRK